MSKLIPLRIDRKRWARGGKNGSSALLNIRGAMCCLGFACKKLGVPPEGIDEVSVPIDVDLKHRSKLAPLLTKKGHHRATVNDAIDVNDDNWITEQDREERLTPILRKLGFDVTFVGKDD